MTANRRGSRGGGKTGARRAGPYRHRRPRADETRGGEAGAPRDAPSGGEPSRQRAGTRDAQRHHRDRRRTGVRAATEPAAAGTGRAAAGDRGGRLGTVAAWAGGGGESGRSGYTSTTAPRGPRARSAAGPCKPRHPQCGTRPRGASGSRQQPPGGPPDSCGRGAGAAVSWAVSASPAGVCVARVRRLPSCLQARAGHVQLGWRRQLHCTPSQSDTARRRLTSNSDTGGDCTFLSMDLLF